MAIQYKDYYEILGLTREARDEDIRKAFRRLARMHHPDKNGNDQHSEERFKDLNEAYEVLGDPAKRRRYDDFQAIWRVSPSPDDAWRNFVDGSGTDSPPNRAEHFTFTGAGFSEFFDELFGQNAGSFRPRGGPDVRTQAEVREQTGGRGEDLEADITVSLEEVAQGAVRPVTMRRVVRCQTCFGVGQYNGHSCEKCGGEGQFVRTETYKVKIPKGVQPGAFLRISGRGDEGVGGAPAGDLYLKVHYGPHSQFRIENGTLVHDLELAPWEAVLGATVSVPTANGPANIKVPAGTRSGHRLRIKGRGLPSVEGEAGDLVVHVQIQVPASSGTNTRRLWEDLARESNFSPRDN